MHWAEQRETAAWPQSAPRAPASPVWRDLRKASPRWVPSLGQSQPQPGGGVRQGTGLFSLISQPVPPLPSARGPPCSLPSGCAFASRTVSSSSLSHTGKALPAPSQPQLPLRPCGLRGQHPAASMNAGVSTPGGTCNQGSLALDASFLLAQVKVRVAYTSTGRAQG